MQYQGSEYDTRNFASMLRRYEESFPRATSQELKLDVTDKFGDKFCIFEGALEDRKYWSRPGDFKLDESVSVLRGLSRGNDCSVSIIWQVYGIMNL